MTIKRILCPVDFSEPSRHAIDYALAIARWSGASISALHVYQPMFMPVPGLPAPDHRVPDVELSRIQAETADMFKTARSDADEVAVDFQIKVGRPAGHIISVAASLPADLIVIGTHGAGGFEHLVLGSVTERVLRNACCPVLTVPPRAQTTSKLPFRHVLCAVDFSRPSQAAVDFAFSLAHESGSTLTLLHVIEWPWKEPPAPHWDELPKDQAAALAEYRRYMEKSATARLESLVPSVIRERCATACRVVHGKPYAELLRVAEEDAADLIVMGVHGRNAADLTLFGSTTNQVVRRASCPVLTVRR